MSRQPDFLTLGHVTRDVQADGSFTLGGTVTFAAQTAYHLGLAVAVVTCADAEVARLLLEALPGIALQICPSPQTTTFANRYHEGFRTQYLYERAVDIVETDIPWIGVTALALFSLVL
ncbi:hypothetical protein [Dictyobacter kobayashii]|uniref:Ribokinase n=1 Tax=Dictyobacter kobayashii TaxID=2014872 RepID=A0A402AJ64_9CHLR|nr:hypothetical protein [Dictyobacter kobayashii]GCE19152.1 hypothetical protein KDK_29520 [Dictyobacter kobayashii]